MPIPIPKSLERSPGSRTGRTGARLPKKKKKKKLLIPAEAEDAYTTCVANGQGK